MKSVGPIKCFVLLCLILFTAGCDSSEEVSTGTIQRETMWSTKEPGKVGGIDQAVVTQVELEAEDMFFVVWSDMTNNVPFDNYGIDEQTRFRGGHGDVDGGRLEFSVSSSNTKQLKIDDQVFDLAARSLFLVKTADGKTVVQQLSLAEDERMPGSRQGLMMLVQSKPEIEKFFTLAQ